MNIPKQFTAGDSVTWLDDAAQDGITSATWALTYVLRGATALTITATPEGTGWRSTITAAQSQSLTPGTYAWQASATSGLNRTTLGSGTLSVLADLAYAANPAAYDPRSQAEQDLDALRAEMRARVTGGSVQEYSIGNRSLKKMPMPDLIALESKLKADVTREQRRAKLAAGLDSGRAVFVRFGGK